MQLHMPPFQYSTHPAELRLAQVVLLARHVDAAVRPHACAGVAGATGGLGFGEGRLLGGLQGSGCWGMELLQTGAFTAIKRNSSPLPPFSST